MPDSRTITESEHLQLLGLFVLHARAVDEERRIAAAVGAIVGEEEDGYGYYGLVSDELAEITPSVNDLLKRLDIEVVSSQ